jgi:hypothetical protein
MAFTDTEKVKIVTDLGYPGLVLVPDSIHYVNWINDRLDNLTTPIEACVRDILDRLEKMDLRLEKAVCRAGIERVDGISFNGSELALLRKERCKIIKELSLILDIPSNSCGSVGNVCL